MEFNIWVLFYLILINIITFLLFGVDKWKAAHEKWRIPERTLFLFAGLGGSFGARLGMSVFRHKTKHRSFTIGIPSIFIAQCILVLLFYSYFGN